MHSYQEIHYYLTVYTQRMGPKKRRPDQVTCEIRKAAPGASLLQRLCNQGRRSRQVGFLHP